MDTLTEKIVKIVNDSPYAYHGYYSQVAKDISALLESQIKKRDEIIEAQKELIDMYLFPNKGIKWKDVADNIEVSIELMNKINQLKSEL